MSQRLALIIGNDNYDDKNLASLKAPGADVENLARILRDPTIGSFDEVTTLINEISSIVQRAIAYFFTRKKRDDFLLLYFSGHGILDDQGRLFLAVKDTSRDLPTATGIPAAFITDEMDRSRSQRQVLMLDCCHSGAFARGAKKALGASVGTAAAFEGTGFGRVVITATDSTQYAWEGDQVFGEAGNSVFTHFLVQGLETGEADRDADGLINLDELFDYIYEHVVTETSKQTPVKWGYKRRGEIIIARNPHPAKEESGLPAELQQAIENPIPEVREGAVRVLEGMLGSIHQKLALAAFEALKTLTKDDSRRVSSAANAILEKYRKKPDWKTGVAEEIESEAEGIVTADRRGIIRKITPAAADIFGYRADELIGKNVSMLMPSPYREEHDGYIANYLKTGDKKIIGMHREVTGQRKDDATFPMDIVIEEIRLGNQIGFTANIQDITERKEAEKALFETLEAVDFAEIEPEQTSGQTETSQVEDETDEFKTTQTAEETGLTQRKSQFAEFKAVWDKRKVVMVLLLGVIVVAAFIWLRPGTSVDSEPISTNDNIPADITTTPPSGKIETSLPPGIVSAQNRAEQTRKQARASQAGLYAPNIFASAKQKEESAANALEAQNYKLAESLFTEAENEYSRAARQASTTLTGLQNDTRRAREKAETARKTALNGNAAEVESFRMAISQYEKGEQEQAKGNYRPAQSAFSRAEQLFHSTLTEVGAAAELRKLISQANAAEQKALNVKDKIDATNAKTSAEEAYHYASGKLNQGRSYISGKNYTKAVTTFEEAAKGFERVEYENNLLQSAQGFSQNGDYAKSLEELQKVLAPAPYRGENKTARELYTTVVAAKKNFDNKISEAQNAKNAGELLRALNILNTLPEQEKNAPLTQRLSRDIFNSDRTPPEIFHDPPNIFKPAESIKIRVTVKDNLKVKEVALNYRRKGDKNFLRENMQLTGKDEYTGTIPKNFHRGKEIRYYFNARDFNGNEVILYLKGDKLFEIKEDIPPVIPRVP
jgi:PAS domain S-box-containing protein